MTQIPDLNSVITTQLLAITKYLVDNPGLGQNRSYKLNEIIELPKPMGIHSDHIFAMMSSAFSLDKSRRKQFYTDFPETRQYMRTLGPNRLQYAMQLFDFLWKHRELISSIVQQFISAVPHDSIMDIYEQQDDFHIKKGVYLGSPDKIKANILLIEKDQRIRNLRYRYG